MFRTVPLSIIRSFSLYTTMRTGSGWNCVQSWSCWQAVSKPVWHTPFLCVQRKTSDDGQRNCPKHVGFHSKNNEDPSWFCSQAVRKLLWHKPLSCAQWKTPDKGQRNCPKHVEIHSKTKFEKLVPLVGFIIRNLTRCTVTWTLTLRRLMSYIYGAPILDVSRSHTTTQHSR